MPGTRTADVAARPDVLCKLCFAPEGASPFARVGKRKVAHADCASAWSREDREEGLEHMCVLQIEREEAVIADIEGLAEARRLLTDPEVVGAVIDPEIVRHQIERFSEGEDGKDQAAR